jgi:hypothetical protein
LNELLEKESRMKKTTLAASEFQTHRHEVPSKEALSRRTFLQSSGLGAIGVTMIPIASLVAIPAESYAQNFTALTADVGKTLLKMARDIFPHDRIPDEHYMAVLAPYVTEAAGNPELKSLMTTGVTNLDAVSMTRFGKAYAEIPAEGDRVSLLYGIEQTEFFQKVRSDLKSQLYNNQAVWPLFGYEGSSWDKGGYLHRGFDDIDWLGSL